MRSGSHALAAKPTPASSGKARPSLTSVVIACLEDAKAENIVSIDLNGKAALADTMIIASGRSNRHVSAIADQLSRALKSAGYDNVSIEGLPHCDWVIMDAGDVIVHIFRPEVRDFYNIEKLWSPNAPTEADLI
jgi:ribosome-associated protein